MNRGQLPIKQLSASNWGAFDHASHAPQLLADNYYVYPHPIAACTYITLVARHTHMLCTHDGGAAN